MQSVRPFLVNALAKQVRSYHAKGHHVPPHMNELPVPCGSWTEFTKIRMRRHNTVLAGGVAFLGFTLIVAKSSGLIYFNYSPPDSI